MLERQIEEKNNDIKPITHKEMALFAYHVYEDKGELPQGWERVLRTDNKDGNGYAGAFYFHKAGGPYGYDSAVLAHRGTVMNMSNIVDDLRMALGYVPKIIKHAEDFYREGVEYLASKYGYVDSLYVTGHSLGAVISDFTRLFELKGDSHDARGAIGKTITFENPGSKPLIIEFLNERGNRNNKTEKEIKEEISNYFLVCNYHNLIYQSQINIINTCNEQVCHATSFWIADYEYDLSIPFEQAFYPSPIYAGNTTYLLNTIKFHSMATVLYNINHFAYSSQEYPYGFQRGYAYFLNVDSPNNTTFYWNKLVEKYYKEDSKNGKKIRDSYLSFNSFKDACFNLLRKVYKDMPKGENANEFGNFVLEPPKLLTGSGMGLFKEVNLKKNPTDKLIDEFVLIENKNIIEDEQEPKKRCSIM